VVAAVTVGGRLFQALVPAAEKDRSPSVDLRVAGTTNADEVEDLRRCRDSNCATCCNCSERYAGARLCLHLNTCLAGWRRHVLLWVLLLCSVFVICAVLSSSLTSEVTRKESVYAPRLWLIARKNCSLFTVRSSVVSFDARLDADIVLDIGFLFLGGVCRFR